MTRNCLPKGVVAVASACFCASVAHGFEPSTHGFITYEAFKISNLGKDSGTTDQLGLSQWLSDPVTQLNPFGGNLTPQYYEGRYPDYEGARLRTVNRYEFDRMPVGVPSSGQSGGNPGLSRPFVRILDRFTVSGWLLRGAIREDDNPKEMPADDVDFPNAFHRELNHFYDPQHGRRIDQANSLYLTYYQSDFHNPPPYAYVKEPFNWALGSVDAFAAPGSTYDGKPQTEPINLFTILNFRESQYRALTLQGQNFLGQVVDLFPSGQGSASERLLARKRWWATAFRSLGNVLHLNQDMAQPQHVKNEPHSGKFDNSPLDRLSGHQSTMEAYVDARAKGNLDFMIDGQRIVPSPLVYGGYPIPKFAYYRDFWVTVIGNESPNNLGRGLADYTSRGFFTPRYNIGNSDFDFPLPAPNAYSRVLSTYPIGTATVPVWMYKGIVDDRVTGASDLINMASDSLWSLHAPGSHSLNRLNYDDQAKLLIPRAVSYSAGLLDFAFRGKLNISLPSAGVYGLVDHSAQKAIDAQGFKKLLVRVGNTTSSILASSSSPTDFPVDQNMSEGTLVAIVKFHRNNCYLEDLSGEYGSPGKSVQGCRVKEEEIVVSDPVLNVALAAQSSSPTWTPTEYPFTFPSPIPINATDIFLQIVFRGRLGSEKDAVVVGTKDIPEPTFWSVHNASDLIMCIDGQTYYKTTDPENPFPPEVEAILSSHQDWRSRLQSKPISTLGLFETLNPEPLAQTQLPIPPGGFARVAMLMDRDRSFFHVPTPFAPGGAGGLNLSLNQVDVPLVGPQLLMRFRQTYAHNVRFTYADAGSDCNSTLAIALPQNEPTRPAATLKPITPAMAFLPAP